MDRGFASRLIIIAGTTIALTACASTGGVPRPFPTPGGPPAAPAASAPEPAATSDPESEPLPPEVPDEAVIPVPAGSGDGYAIAGAALALRGVPYRNGGTDPSGFDCSGLVQYVFARYGLSVPRDVRHQYREGKSIKRDKVEPGDLVFFSTVSRGASHVGIALGGDQFVHAPSSSGVVRVERMSAEYWSKRFVGIRRMPQ